MMAHKHKQLSVLDEVLLALMGDRGSHLLVYFSSRFMGSFAFPVTIYAAECKKKGREECET